jgi:hypothetical protein
MNQSSPRYERFGAMLASLSALLRPGNGGPTRWPITWKSWSPPWPNCLPTWPLACGRRGFEGDVVAHLAESVEARFLPFLGLRRE